MTRYLLRRLISTTVLLLVMASMVYVIFYALPSNPAVLVCGKGCGGGQLAAIDHKLGLDQPEYVQFWHFLEGIVAGRDYSTGTGVRTARRPAWASPTRTTSRSPADPDQAAGHRVARDRRHGAVAGPRRRHRPAVGAARAAGSPSGC